MSIFQELNYDTNIDNVVGVQFSILSPDEIRRRSVAEIFTHETYDGDTPKVGGLFDPRMGVLDHGKKCPTDQLDNRHCPGYFGHIELALPVFHIQYLKYIVQTLKSVCWKCSKLRIDTSDMDIRKTLKKKGVNRFLAVVHLCSKVKRCGDKNNDGCGAPMPNVIKKDNNGIGKLIVEWKLSGDSESQKLYWDAGYVEKILRRITDEECEILGFNKNFCRPEWLICSVFGVSPPSVRPSVRSDNNTRMEDDLTHKLCDIVKTNRTLKSKIQNKSPKRVIDEWYQLLQYHIATFVDNTLPGIPPAQQRSGRSLKSIKERLKSKEGRVRGNLMGKRVDYSARSVITPDPNIGINELGVPEEIAKNLTFPDIVTPYNIQELNSIVKNGYDVYPGAKSIKRISDGKIISLKVIDTKNYQLEIGDIVNRHLIDGDRVLFNRQPSLHKMSMMSHRIRVLPYKTFRLNVSVTTPYNADFDGDEMNMHVPQSLQTVTELKELASVETQIITPATHKPIIALVQDSIIGSYLFTRYDNYLTKNEVFDLFIWITDFDGNIPEPDIKKNTSIDDLPKWFPKYKYLSKLDTENNVVKIDLWSGRTVFTLIIPDINLTKKNDSAKSEWQDKFMNNVVIKMGKIENGVLDKSILGTKEQGLIHIIYNEFGKERAQKFINDAQNIITNWVLMSGFSVGLGDLMADRQSAEKMSHIISDKKKKVIEIIEHVHRGILKNDSGQPNSNEFETQILSQLSNAMNEAGKIGTNYLDSNNRMINLVNSGSKGSDINIGQMIACVGQQSVDGKRIPYGFTDRTLPHFHKYDDGAAARGFVENSFIKGLTPTEFFFHAMGGREGLIDTAVKTSETGYIQRRLVKGMEDVRVEFDYSVRNANGSIVQFLYGEDGMDPIHIEKQIVPSVKMNFSKLEEKYKLMKEDNWKDYLYVSTYKKFNKYSDKYLEDIFDSYFKQILDDKRYLIEYVKKGKLLDSDIVYYPINLKRLITNVKTKFKKNNKTTLCPIYILEKIKELNDTLSITNNLFGENKMFMILVRCYLAPKVIIKELRLSKSAFDFIIGNIKQQFFSSVSQPGELVGVISAQSIGEPSTQMTLNTFHFAGVSSKSQVTRGLPRFKELLSTTKNVKSPYITIHLKDEFLGNKDIASKLINEISIITIKQLITSTEIYFEKNQDILVKNQDKYLMDIYNEFQSLNIEECDSQINPWVLKLQFDRRKLVEKNIKMIDIYYAIISKFNSSKDPEIINCVYTDDNSSDLVLRIQYINKLSDEIVNCESAEEDTICMLKTLEKTILNDIILNGIMGITNASMYKEDDNYKYNVDTHSFEQNTEWVIETSGTNLVDIFKHPYIDASRTISNDIHEVYEILGIEAARTLIINEINDIFSQSSSYVNFRHLALLADVITNRGELMSIDRHGINKSDRGPLAKCSFEETPDIIARAALFGELDLVKGVSSNIMLGQEVPIGTGSVNLLFDEEKFIEMSKEIMVSETKEEKIEIDTEKQEFLDKLCKPDNFIDNMFDNL